MRKLGWYALRATVGAFVLVGGALLAANLYVQSHGVQQRIRTLLVTVLRTPVSLRKTTVTPWDGIRLDGVTLHKEEASEPGEPTDFLTVSSFRVQLAWWPLLSRHEPIVEQVLLDQPCLTLREENPDRLLAREEFRDEPPPGVSASSSAPPLPSAVTPFAPPATADEEPNSPAPAKWFLRLVKKARLRHGEIVSQDHTGHTHLRVEEINADARIADSQHGTGALWFARAGGDLPGAALTDYWTALDYDDAGLAVHDGRGTLAGGALTTDARLRPQDGRWSFTTADKLDNVALGQLTRASAEQPPLAEGLLHANVDLHGFADDWASVSGGGRVWLTGARLRDFPLLKIIGQVLRIADLSQLDFRQAQMDYRLEDNTFHVDGLTLVSNDGQMVMHGQYLIAEDQLDFHGRLTIDRAISHQLPQFIESNFTRCGAEAPGSRYLDFDVTGEREDPRCNLYDRLTAGPMKGLLDNLLAPRTKPPKKSRLAPGGVPPKP